MLLHTLTRAANLRAKAIRMAKNFERKHPNVALIVQLSPGSRVVSPRMQEALRGYGSPSKLTLAAIKRAAEAAGYKQVILRHFGRNKPDEIL